MTDRPDNNLSKKELLREVEELRRKNAQLQALSREYRQTEEALRENEESFRRLTEATFEGIIIHDNGIILEVNQLTAGMFGYTRQELIGRDVLELAAPRSRSLITEKIRSANTEPYEAVGRRKDGSEFFEEVHAKIILYKGHTARVAAVRDISVRKKTEAALRVQKKYQEELFEGSPDAIVILDNNDRVLRINREFIILFGYSEAEAIGKQINDLIVPPKLEEEGHSLTAKVARGKRIYVESVRMSKSGKPIDVAITGKPIILQNDQLAVYGIYRDITGRKRAERLKNAAYRIAEAALTADDPNYLMASIHKIIAELIPANNFYIALYDAVNDLISFPYFVDEFEAAPGTEKPGKGLTEYVLRTGEPLLATPKVFGELEKKGEVESVGPASVDWLGVPLKIKDKTIGVLTVQSYTEGIRFGEEEKNILVFVSAQIAMAIERKRAGKERQRLEEQLLHARKMEAIGTLAGGIAHDFNNILSAIIGYTELALKRGIEDGKTNSYLQHVLFASGRAKETIKQILAFSRKGEKEQEPVLMSDIVRESLKLLRSTLPATIELSAAIKAVANPVLADSSQIHQVIMNLCTNAAYAMREKGGKLEICLEEIDFDPADIKRRDLPSGRYNRLTFSDTGHGMPVDIKNRIFEPYFTTKGHGEGTGMGLAVAHGIVKSHKGEITVQSEPGKGTTFTIYFPVTDRDRSAAVETGQSTAAPGGNEKILFVDDEQSLVEVGKHQLEGLGYRVVSSTVSSEALEVFRAAPHQFDLVITDQTMPGKTGVQLTAEIKKIRADIPVILCTGFSEKVNEENFSSRGIDAFAMKPLAGDKIARLVRRVLDN